MILYKINFVKVPLKNMSTTIQNAVLTRLIKCNVEKIKAFLNVEQTY